MYVCIYSKSGSGLTLRPRPCCAGGTRGAACDRRRGEGSTRGTATRAAGEIKGRSRGKKRHIWWSVYVCTERYCNARNVPWEGSTCGTATRAAREVKGGSRGANPTWSIRAAKKNNPESRFLFAHFMNPCTSIQRNPRRLPVVLAKWIPDSLNPGGGNEYRIRDCPRRVRTLYICVSICRWSSD